MADVFSLGTYSDVAHTPSDGTSKDTGDLDENIISEIEFLSFK